MCVQLAMKRKVCIYRQKGDFASAIAELNKYLKIFAADETAWQELTELYMATEKYISLCRTHLTVTLCACPVLMLGSLSQIRISSILFRGTDFTRPCELSILYAVRRGN